MPDDAIGCWVAGDVHLEFSVSNYIWVKGDTDNINTVIGAMNDTIIGALIIHSDINLYLT